MEELYHDLSRTTPLSSDSSNNKLPVKKVWIDAEVIKVVGYSIRNKVFKRAASHSSKTSGKNWSGWLGLTAFIWPRRDKVTIAGEARNSREAEAIDTLVL